MYVSLYREYTYEWISQFEAGYWPPLANLARLRGSTSPGIDRSSSYRTATDTASPKTSSAITPSTGSTACSQVLALRWVGYEYPELYNRIFGEDYET